jgi:alcohol dehydrogenase
MGAAKVIALGRDKDVLSDIHAVDLNRVTSVVLEGVSIEEDTGRIKRAAGRNIDAYFDMTGRAPTPEPIMAALGALGHGGTAVLMGGVQALLPLPYSQIMLNELTIRGNFMYPRSAPRDLLNMVLAGTLDLNKFALDSFGLDDIEKAIDRAAESKGLKLTVIRPQR